MSIYALVHPFLDQNRLIFKSSDIKFNDSMRMNGYFLEDHPQIFYLCPIHVLTFTLISILATDYIQKRRVEPGLFSSEYNLSPKLISN